MHAWALGTVGRRADLKLSPHAEWTNESVALHGNALFVFVQKRADQARLSLQRVWSPEGERSELLVALLQVPPSLVLPESLQLFVAIAGDEVLFVGEAKQTMCRRGEAWYLMHEPPLALDAHLPAHAPIDGAMLRDHASTLGGLAFIEAFAASWLGPLPKASATHFDAPEHIMAWHDLLARLALIADHNFACFSANWHLRGEDTTFFPARETSQFFQDLEHEGGTFYLENGQVGIRTHHGHVDDRIYANDLWEFALVFVIESLVFARSGYLAEMHATPRDEDRLPFGTPTTIVQFLGGEGWIGMAQGDVIRVRAVDREALHRVVRAHAV